MVSFQGTHKPVRLGCMLTLGTGKAPVAESKTIDLDLPTRIRDVGKVFNVIDSVVHLKSVLIEQVASADGTAVSRARAWAHSLPVPFFRYSPHLPEAIDLAETRNSVLIEMLWQTKVSQ